MVLSPKQYKTASLDWEEREMNVTLAAAAANFGRDLEENYATIARLLADARTQGAALLALPEATLGGYLSSLGGPGDPRKPKSLPPALRLDGPELARVISMAGETIIVLGICEAYGPENKLVRYNTAVALNGTGILGLHRKVHQPLGENMSYDPGSEFAAFESPIGRMGLLICQDKAFPEAARSLALDDAAVIVCISAWPGSRTGSTADLQEDRWTKRFTIFDQARASRTRSFGSRRTSQEPSARCAMSATPKSYRPGARSSRLPVSMKGWLWRRSTSPDHSQRPGGPCFILAIAGRSFIG